MIGYIIEIVHMDGYKEYFCALKKTDNHRVNLITTHRQDDAEVMYSKEKAKPIIDMLLNNDKYILNISFINPISQCWIRKVRVDMKPVVTRISDGSDEMFPRAGEYIGIDGPSIKTKPIKAL